ncbi:AsnC family transcriptional regulator [Sporohalobacter salinus]|uniref:siroheme decarboxylase subunit alpha n=1 Tax=Sporohalobacter salinus TaxID=1494606 RepID=UPI00196029D8|nr:DNA-binding Lrp family transcriptional regulator [Sporohalobacter salinus]
MKKELDPVNKKLLNLIQHNFSITSEPYKEIGEKLGLSTEEVIDRLKELKEASYIRRIGGVFDSKKLGYVSTLVACKVKETKYYEVANNINKYQGVTHNYRRDHEFNLWFTLIASSPEKLSQQLEEINELDGIEVLRNLPAKRFFKLGVNFELKQQDKEES